MTPSEIIAHVALQHGLTVRQLKEQDRHRARSYARFEAMALLRLAGLSLPQIGQALGGRHHTTILAGLRTLARAMQQRAWLGEHLRVLNALRRPSAGELVAAGGGL